VPIQFTGKPGLVIYLTVGDPSLAATEKIALAAIDAGADVLELGVPFSDPLADGPVIQRASERALRNGVTLQDVLRLAADLRRERPAVGLVIFSYFNPILQMGLERFAAEAAASGVDGVLVTDLIVEEAAEYRRVLARHGLQPIFLAAPTSPESRLREIAGASQGFIYAIARTGVTGAQKDLAADARAVVERIRPMTQLPIALGFGISSPAQVAAAADFADAVVVGSAIVARIEASPEAEAPRAVGDFIASLRGVSVAQ
jgi:tryptophan synthase alpha chain